MASMSARQLPCAPRATTRAEVDRRVEEGDVVGDRALEQDVVLQDDADQRREVGRGDRLQVADR
jgi:hypothetical protein